MKYSIAILLITTLLVSCKSKNTARTIKFNVDKTEDYCGGAFPEEEILAEFRKPKPYSGKLYVHSKEDRIDDGIELVFVEGKCTASGFSDRIYYVFLQPKMTPKDHIENQKLLEQGIDIGCLEGENMRASLRFEIVPSTKSISAQVHFICDPCTPPRP